MELEQRLIATNISVDSQGLQTQLTLLHDFIKIQAETIEKLSKQLEESRRVIHRQAREIEQLKSEIRRLKELKTKPKIRPSRMNKNKDKDNEGTPDGKRPGSKKRNKNDTLVIHKTKVIKAVDIPLGSRFKGYQEYIVQGLMIEVENQLFKLERWQLPDGSYKVAELPEGIKGHHFSPELRAYILHQHHHQGVTQLLLLAQLHEWGVDISSGQLNRILIEDKEIFHNEKKEILSVGLSISKYIQVDDTGARHDGSNGYCTHIGNELFAWFESTNSKSRINFLTLLMQGHTDYLLDEHSLAYMKRHKLAPKYRKALSNGQRYFENEAIWLKYLEKHGLKSKYHRRIATEGALIGALLFHGFRMDLAILSDDAGQFNIFEHALCWIHAERKINELIGFSDAQRKAVDEIRGKFWAIYDKLKVYKNEDSSILKQEIEKEFDELCVTKTCYQLLNNVLKRMRDSKKELLLVLERPEIPLHNNLSENDIREYVKKRKISGSTRSEEGRRCRDTFTSLKKTCKKLNVRFWDYLLDRLSGKYEMPLLSTLMSRKVMVYG